MLKIMLITPDGPGPLCIAQGTEASHMASRHLSWWGQSSAQICLFHMQTELQRFSNHFRHFQIHLNTFELPLLRLEK